MTKVPVPPGGNAEGSMDYACDVSSNDCHLLIDQGPRLYELYQANLAGGQAAGSPFTTSCEVVWDLTHDYWQAGTPYSRGDRCTSADAAGMPIAPLLVTGAELQAGVVSHAMRFTLPNPRIRSGVYMHPGTHAGGPSGDSMMPGYAARFRLRSSFDMSTLPSAGAKTIAVALQKYGMFLDDGGNIPLTIDQSAATYVDSHDRVTPRDGLRDRRVAGSLGDVDGRLHANAHHELIDRVPRAPEGLLARRLRYAKAGHARRALGAIHRRIGARERAFAILSVAVGEPQAESFEHGKAAGPGTAMAFEPAGAGVGARSGEARAAAPARECSQRAGSG